MTDTQNTVVRNQAATDQKFEQLTRLLIKCIRSEWFVLLSCTMAIVVAVGAAYCSNMTSATVTDITDAIRSLEATLEKKFEQGEQDSRAHFTDAIKSLEATLEKKFEQGEQDSRAHFTDAIKSLETHIEEALERKLHQLRMLNILKGNPTSVKAKKNCVELYKSGQTISGVYTIDPDGSGTFDVFCDQTTAGGGWTVFQKRLDGSVHFYRGWADYKRGFGNLNGEFWLGLDKIHRLTKTKNRLRVDLENTYAEYDMFAVTSERTKYKLSLGSYSGTAGDSLSLHRGYPFTTKDQDNDSWSQSNCAVANKGAWWYQHCHHSNLNGLYHHGKHSSSGTGVMWYHWKGVNYSAKRAEMKIRPVDF